MDLKNTLLEIFIDDLRSQGCRCIDDVERVFRETGWTGIFTSLDNHITKNELIDELSEYFP